MERIDERDKEMALVIEERKGNMLNLQSSNLQSQNWRISLT